MITALFQNAMLSEDMHSVSSPKFQTLKARYLATSTLLRKHGDLKGARRHQLIDAVWHGDFTAANNILSSLTLRSKVMKRSLLATGDRQISNLDSFVERCLSKDDRHTAFDVSDIRFLTELADMPNDEPILKRFAMETTEAFKDHFVAVVKKLSKMVRTEAISILREEREQSLRATLFRQISNATLSQSHL
jgi:hypothetical protein